jgi:hypothetical protein
MKMRLPLAAALLIGFCGRSPGADFSSGPPITVSGLNELRYADGYDMSRDLLRPWEYLLNSTDARVQTGGLYLKMRFDVEEPSLGYNPPDPVYREYFSRRTIGFETDPFIIEAGHVTTQFGRGLTLSLKEDRDIEQYSILDGVFGQVRFPWMTLLAIVGRPIEWLSKPIALLDVSEWGDPDTILIGGQADLRMRNIIAGGFAEMFLPVDKPIFSFFSSGSVGAGLVRYNTDVGPLSPGFRDTADLDDPFWYQNRTALYLPSASISLSQDAFSASMEQAWMRGTEHQYFNSMDSNSGAFDSTSWTPTGTSTYLSAQAQLFGVSLLLEYKNYYYDKSHAFSKEVSAFLIPPAVRYQHSWHLLNKHMLSNLMADAVGYNAMLTWSPTQSATVIADFNFGGTHKPGRNYWEAYGEWQQETGDLLTTKVGFDYGKLEPEQQQATYRTLACDIETGPYGKGHSFGLTLETQLNDKPFLSEKDNASLIDLIRRTVPSDSLKPFINQKTGDTIARDPLLYDYLVPDGKRSNYRQYALNLLVTLSYHFVPWLTVAVTFEHEMKLDDRDYIHDATEIDSKSRNYASLGVSLKPNSSNTISMEFGSMSGGKKCTLGTCVDIPVFKGFKLTITSML